MKITEELVSRTARLARLDLPVEDIEGFAEEFCRRFGYEAPLCQMENGRGMASAVQLAGEENPKSV